MLSRVREPEGPFGEFPGYYSGCHLYPVIEIDRISHRKDPIYNSVYVGRPWTELDFLQAMTTSVPLFVQLYTMFPEVLAVNALYTQAWSLSFPQEHAMAASPRPLAWAC